MRGQIINYVRAGYPGLYLVSLLYGKDNPIDGVVLDVILRKIREIRRSIGITIPFPEDSKSIIDTIAHALLLNPDRKISVQGSHDQAQFIFEEFDEAKKAKLSVSQKLAEAEQREKASRSIFAQHAIKAHEIEADLKEVDQAIGNPQAVESFVTSSLNNVLGVQIERDKKGYRLFTANLPYVLKTVLPAEDMVLVSFESPTPEDYLYLGRNHPFVEQLCQLMMANSISHNGRSASRSAVVRCREVTTKTTILLLRCRNVIEEKKAKSRIVAEEMLIWGYRGAPAQKDFLNSEQAGTLLSSARPSANLTPEARSSFLDNELKLVAGLQAEMDAVAEKRSQHLVEAHERFSQLMDQKQFQVVYPVLPMDVMGKRLVNLMCWSLREVAHNCVHLIAKSSRTHSDPMPKSYALILAAPAAPEVWAFWSFALGFILRGLR